MDNHLSKFCVQLLSTLVTEVIIIVVCVYKTCFHDDGGRWIVLLRETDSRLLEAIIKVGRCAKLPQLDHVTVHLRWIRL